jgi:hypothetical protein
MVEFEFHISPAPELVVAPDGRRHLWYELEETPCAVGIVAESARAPDGLGDVRDDPAAPAPYFVAEEAEASGCPVWAMPAVSPHLGSSGAWSKKRITRFSYSRGRAGTPPTWAASSISHSVFGVEAAR